MPYRSLLLLFAVSFAAHAQPGSPPGKGSLILPWEEVKSRFLAQNPNVMAGQLNIDEAKANEITAGLRPNPQFDLSGSGFQAFPSGGLYRPLSSTLFVPQLSYLIERQNKRGLRVQSARLATSGASTDQEDLKRTLLFAVRSSFVSTLQAKALLALTEEDLKYYDNVIAVNQERYRGGDISQLDLQRVEIQRVQFESDLATARVNLRTAKIQLLALLNDRTAVESFDVTGNFSYQESIVLLPEMRRMALEQRPDVRSAQNAIEKARADHRLAIANGTADPTVSANYTWNPQLGNPDATSTFGGGINIPLRIFDKNQGEKARTSIEIKRTELLRDGLVANLYRDVDSAYETIESTRSLLRAYRDKYLQASFDIRDKVSFSYSQGGSTLLDFLDAQRSYRTTQITYLNLVGSYYSALAQLSLAVGQEVNP